MHTGNANLHKAHFAPSKNASTYDTDIFDKNFLHLRKTEDGILEHLVTITETIKVRIG